jgi:hypothetical protein
MAQFSHFTEQKKFRYASLCTCITHIMHAITNTFSLSLNSSYFTKAFTNAIEPCHFLCVKNVDVPAAVKM